MSQNPIKNPVVFNGVKANYCILALTRQQKQKIIKSLQDQIARQKAMLFVDFTGLSTKELFEFKNELKKVKADLKVAKKTLLNIALCAQKVNLDIKRITGQLAVIFGFGRELDLVKTVYQFSIKNEKLKILFGFLDNQFRDKNYLITLAQLPSTEELFAKLVGAVSSPLVNFIELLRANIKGLIYVLTKVKT